MNKLSTLFTCFAIVASSGFFSSCNKQEGCMDPSAANFDPEAKESGGSCIYPNVLTDVTAFDFDAEVYGTGGTNTKTTSWSVAASQVDYDLSLTTGSTGSISLVVTDGAGVVVLNETVSSGGQMGHSGMTAVGTAGTWTVSITATNLNGHGDVSMSY